MEPPSMKFRSSMRGQTTKFVFSLSWSSQARCSKDPWEAKHKKMCSASNFQHWKLVAKHIFCVLNYSSKAPKHVECNFFCAWPPTFRVKSWRSNAKKLLWPLLELSSLEFKSSKRGQGKNICAWPPTLSVESSRLSIIFFALAFLGTQEHGVRELQKRLRKIFLPLSNS
jgi:hypothetical protein